MKIKITESQYSKIRIVKEQEEYIERYKSFCAEKANEADNIYSKIINESVGDILGMSINAEQLNSMVDKIENSVLSAEKNMESLYSQGLITGPDLELSIADIASSVTDKLTSIALLLNCLEKIQGYEQEHHLSHSFKNIKPLEIQTFGPENS